MWHLLKPLRARTKARRTPTRRPRHYRPHCSTLEDRCLLSVSLTSGAPPVPLAGSPVTWTATATGLGPTPVYQFSAGLTGGPLQMVQDFSTTNTFVWNPIQQGTYEIQVIAKDGFSASTGESATASLTAESRVVGSSAVVSPMANPLVALYSAPPSPGSSMYVQFAPLGANPSWTATAPQPIVPGESTNIIVAGMLPDTTYLMRDVLSNGTASAPLEFTTGSLPANLKFPTFTEQQPPAPGSVLSQDMIFHAGIGGPPTAISTVATNPAGNVVWYYDSVAHNFPSYAPNLVPGGTVLLLGGDLQPESGAAAVAEIDLAGDTLRETNTSAVNAELAAMGQPSITFFSHEATRLPNGDTAVLGYTYKTIDVNGTPTQYQGDMVIVLNQNFQVSWAWNPFDWLPTSRLPTLGEGPGDWLHANAISWSPEDGDLIVSLRAQDWVLKVDYADGTGDGHIIWTLGQGGSFTVIAPPGTQDPWFSHQHNAFYINDTTIVVFDDGNVRRATDPTADSRGQEWVLNEQTMTATLVVNADLGGYSSALGAAQMLPDGELVFTSGLQVSDTGAVFGQTIGVLPDGTQTFVQEMSGLEYRSYAISSFYGSLANILDPGFESPILGSGASADQEDPTGSSWNFSGTAGEAGNGSAITAGNPNAPQADQVAFIQGTGSISQSVQFYAADGSYQISVSAAQRGNNGTSDEEVQVLVDGTVVGTITPTGTSYATYTTAAFNATAGYHTITLVGAGPAGTALIDQVNVNNVSPTTAPGSVNLSSAFNRTGIVADGTTFGGGLDGDGYALSSSLVGPNVIVGGTTFIIGPAGANDAVSAAGQVIALPSGEDGTLKLLATGVNGSPSNQTFTVTYTDGTTATFVQSISDWYLPQGYPGESVALATAYRDADNATTQAGPFNIYAYSFTLNPAKTVKSITLPDDANVEVLAATLVPVATTPVNLSSAFNRTGIVADGTTFGGGLDGGGYALSSSLVGPTVTAGGATFIIGPAGANDAVSAAGQVIALPSGEDGTLKLLATGVNGSQLNQTFTVTYTDGTTATFVQSISDWYLPQGYPGESVALATAYRDADNGTTQAGPFNIYAYSFTLNPAKTVKSITLPDDANVEVLAATLVPATTPQVSIASTFNRTGIVADGTTFGGGLDGGGYALSSSLVGPTVTAGGATFIIGPAGANDAVSAAGQVIALPSGEDSTLKLLATGVNGSQLNQTFTVTYTDGTTATFVQSISDWYLPQGYPGESVALATAYRDVDNGTTQAGPFNIYEYTIALNPTKTVRSITLPSDANVEVLAIDVQPRPT